MVKISVLTLTYQRYEILEEAIKSYLSQDFNGESEMVIINDSPDVEYVYEHPNIRIINCKERFPSISDKIKFGYKQCKYEYIYRLDDDDLLTPWALSLVSEQIEENPDYEIYKTRKHYAFLNNEFQDKKENVNTGIIYTKKYFDRIEFPNLSFGEDVEITFGHKAKIYIIDKDKHTMIYRSGSINSASTYHIGGMGNIGNQEIFNWTDRLIKKENGVIFLNPSFKDDYYSQIE